MGLSTQQRDLIMTFSEGSLPRHVAVIMDGNGRWAKSRGLPRLVGHKRGAERVHDLVEACSLLKIEALSLYAFSDENWGRPQDEVKGLMHLLEVYIKKESQRLKEAGVSLRAMGELQRLPASTRAALEGAIAELQYGKGLVLNIALSYGSRNEITNACRAMAQAVMEGRLKPQDITPEALKKALWTDGLPDPDLLIRTSGEKRLSNFLLWQAAYTEFYFTNTLWPDFLPEDFGAALRDFQSRERRYGLV